MGNYNTGHVAAGRPEPGPAPSVEHLAHKSALSSLEERVATLEAALEAILDGRRPKKRDADV